MAKKSIQNEEELHSEFVEFCKLNGLKVGDFCSEAIKNWLQLEKFGDAPFFEHPTVALVQKADVQNGNGRVYPESVLENAIENAQKEGFVGDLTHNDKSFAEVISGITKLDITLTPLPIKESDKLVTKLLSENQYSPSKPRKRRL